MRQNEPTTQSLFLLICLQISSIKNYHKLINLGLAKFVHFLMHHFMERKKCPICSSVVSSTVDLFQATGSEDIVQNSSITAPCIAMHKSIAK